MATTVTIMEVGGLPASPPRPSSPKLGDFSKIFDMGFFLTSKPNLPDPPVKLPSRPASPLLPETAATAPRFFDGLDFSKLVAPVKPKEEVELNSGSTSDNAESAPKSISPPVVIYSTAASSPPTPSEKIVNDISDAAHNAPSAAFKATGKPTDEPIATREIDGNSKVEAHKSYEAYFSASWTTKAAATPGFNATISAFKAKQIAQQERIVRSQVRALNSLYADEFLFSVPWSCVPYVQDFSNQGGQMPWNGGIPTHVDSKLSTNDSILPLYSLPKSTHLAILKAELLPEYVTDRYLMTTRDALKDPLHVFVDLSNIVIGFYDCIKYQRSIPATQRVRAPPFFFEAFAMLLERGRDVAKRILAGSVVDSWGSWPGYMLEAQQCGYEMNILQRVAKSPKRKGRGGKYDTTSGADSSDDARGATKRLYPLKRGEQGVDEILHLKIAQSILDYNPSTMVLATGDAAEAEYSDGFKKNVERALERGWNVELIAWHKGISSAWRDPNFTQKWGPKFRIVELDLLVEELLGFYTIQ